jgi:iron(III) transport system permease protein
LGQSADLAAPAQLSRPRDVTEKLLRRLAREPVTLVVGLLILLLLLVFVLLPIIEVVTYPSIRDYFELPENGRWLRAGLNTCRMVILSTASATVLGFIYAYVISRPDLPLRAPLRLIATLPLFSPPFTLGFSYLLMYGRFGLITHNVLGFETSILGWKSLWAVQTLTHFPYATLAVERALAATPARFEAAARNLGAGGFTVFRTITLPLVRPALAGAALLIAIYVLADFANPLVIGGDFPLLATEAWYRIDGWGDMRGATLLAATLLPPALVLFAAERFFVGRRRYTVISGRGGSLERARTPRPVGLALFGLCAIVAAIILTLYFGILAGAFTETWGVDWTLTFDKWPVVFSKIDHLLNSFVYAATAGIAATALSTLAAFLVNQNAVPARRAIDFLCVLPAAVPGVFIGIGYLLAFNRPGVPIAGTAIVMILAFTFSNLPFSYQVVRAGLSQIDQHLADAAADLGASRLRVLWDVHLRLLLPSCIAAWTATFVSCITNLSIAIFLVTAGTQVATFSILGLIGDNRLEAASALTTALLAITLLTVSLVWLFSRSPRVVPAVFDA